MIVSSDGYGVGVGFIGTYYFCDYFPIIISNILRLICFIMMKKVYFLFFHINQGDVISIMSYKAYVLVVIVLPE